MSGRDKKLLVAGGVLAGVAVLMASTRKSAARAVPEGPYPPPPPPPPPVVTPSRPPPRKSSGPTVISKGAVPEDARMMMPGVAGDLSAHGANYNRTALKAFQRAAGIAADGLYGGRTRGALLFYGAPIVIPPPMTAPFETYTYVLGKD